MTVRLDEETARKLAELAAHYRSRSAAIQDAIHIAWQRLQADKLEAGYAAAVADNPHLRAGRGSRRAARTPPRPART